MKTSYNILLGLLIMLFALSCAKSVDPEITLDKNLIKSAEKYAALVSTRNDKNGAYSIENIERNADILTVSVKGGCKPEDFQVVWDGLTLLSYPAQIKLVLHNNGVASCKTSEVSTITVNLTKIIGKHDPKDFIFHVANGSVPQDKSLNPDGSVSSK